MTARGRLAIVVGALVVAALTLSAGVAARASGATPRPARGLPRAKAAASTNPLAARPGYVDPQSSAARAADQLRAQGRVTDAAAVRRIAASPAAKWFGDWNGPDPAGAVKRLVDRAAGAQRLPVLVAYDLPGRDCGSYSAGGAPSAAAYRTWIDGFARGVDGRPAAVVVEPDALAGLDCRAAASQAQTLGLLRYAVQKLAAGSTTVYLDAGHDGWQPAAVMADRLRSAGVALARGFALNVSNFKSTGAELQYGRDIAARLPNAHFVIDTSRNGAGPAPDGVWCNPPGRSLGVRPTSSTGAPEADAFLWIKPPGESDGTCNGGPGAGQFWVDYALALAGPR